jgi:hypothetical protein
MILWVGSKEWQGRGVCVRKRSHDEPRSVVLPGYVHLMNHIEGFRQCMGDPKEEPRRRRNERLQQMQGDQEVGGGTTRPIAAVGRTAVATRRSTTTSTTTTRLVAVNGGAPKGQHHGSRPCGHNTRGRQNGAGLPVPKDAAVVGRVVVTVGVGLGQGKLEEHGSEKGRRRV